MGVLRAEGVSEEVKRRFMSLRNNIKIIKFETNDNQITNELDRA